LFGLDVDEAINYRSDIHFWKAGRIGPLIVESDCVLGHEAAGIVLKLGEGVTDLVVGEFPQSFFSIRVFLYLFVGRVVFEKCYVCVQEKFEQ
jgi:hypothetical protein